MHLLTVGAKEFTLDGFHNSSFIWKDCARLSMLYYRHLVFEVHMRVSGLRGLLFHVVILRCVVLMFPLYCGRGTYKLGSA